MTDPTPIQVFTDQGGGQAVWIGLLGLLGIAATWWLAKMSGRRQGKKAEQRKQERAEIRRDREGIREESASAARERDIRRELDRQDREAADEALEDLDTGSLSSEAQRLIEEARRKRGGK